MLAYQEAGWTALGDPTRRAIFERLAERPSAVGELAEAFPVSRPAVSQHLKVLKDAGLVMDRRAGNRRIYHADPNGVAALTTTGARAAGPFAAAVYAAALGYDALLWTLVALSAAAAVLAYRAERDALARAHGPRLTGPTR